MPWSSFRTTPGHHLLGAVSVVILCAFCLPAQTVAAVEPAPTITLGGVIQLGLTAAENALARAHSLGAADAVNASLQAQSVFVEARFAYAGRERSAFSDLGRRDQRCYVALERLRHELLEPGLPNYASVDEVASTIEASLPYHGRHPIIRSFDPQYIAAGATHYRVRFSGNFPEPTAEELAPSLRVGGLKFLPTERTAETLTFDVRIPAPRQGTPEPFTHAVVTLLVPWDSGNWYQVGPFRHIDTATFSLAFARDAAPVTRQAADPPAREMEQGSR